MYRHRGSQGRGLLGGWARWRIAALALLLVALLAPGRAVAAGELEELNPDLAAQLHIKILAYDRALQVRARGKLVLGILYRPEREESERVRGLMQVAFSDRASRSSIQGMPLSVIPVALGDPKTLLKRLMDAGVTLLYVTPGMEDAVATIAAAALALKLPTLTGRRNLLDGGLAVAVVTKEERPSIIVNLPVAKSLGMDLDTSLLRLAEVKR